MVVLQRNIAGDLSSEVEDALLSESATSLGIDGLSPYHYLLLQQLRWLCLLGPVMCWMYIGEGAGLLVVVGRLGGLIWPPEIGGHCPERGLGWPCPWSLKIPGGGTLAETYGDGDRKCREGLPGSGFIGWLLCACMCVLASSDTL